MGGSPQPSVPAQDVGTLIRHGLTTAAGIIVGLGPVKHALVGAGLTADDVVPAIVSLGMAAVAVVWSMIKSRKAAA